MEFKKKEDAELAELADRINASFGAFGSSSREALNHALECGELLIEAKVKLPHGEWKGWIEVHTKVGARQAQKLMRLARYGDQIRANANWNSHLSIDTLLASIKSKPPTPKATAMAHGGAVEALAQDIEGMRRRGQVGRVLEAINTICQIEINPREAVALLKADKERQMVAEATATATAWLCDFQKALEKPTPTSHPPHLRLASEAQPNDVGE